MDPIKQLMRSQQQNFNQHQSLPYKPRSSKQGGESNSNSRQSSNKPRNSNNNNQGYGNCKSDGQFYNRQNRRHDDDDSNNGFGGNGGNRSSSNRNQGNFGSNRTNNNGNSSNNGQGQHSGYSQGYRKHDNQSYLVMPAEEEFEQSSSAFNEVFIDDENKLNKTDCEDNNLEYDEEFELRESHTFATYTKSTHKNAALLLISDEEEDSRQIEELQYDFETIANLKQEQKLKDSANHYEKLSNIRTMNQYEPGLNKPEVKLNKSTCVYSILNNEQTNLNDIVEKPRGKTRKLFIRYDLFIIPK